MTDPETGMSDEQLMALGELAYWSGQAEAGVRYFVELLIKGTAGEVIARGRSFTEMLDLMHRLHTTRPEFASLATYIEEDIVRLRKAMDMRNVMLHGFWDSAEVPSGSLLSVRVNRRHGVHSMENLTAGHIHAAAQQLADACTFQFNTFFDAQAIEAGYGISERADPFVERPPSNFDHD
ncbi:hypothetical protein QN367_17385 [Cryobacterium sp. RTS3]|uniref:hypothetical protein n=1 Tax=Cryobacterium sp. RTS3 TaxID=3048643 RepID=UPI002B22D8CB|nr:hypothetical protein [Cryobacterium sp. RTS3]MEB0000849.1 hypothetical protein [Cryobacterium sp. RTS3]